MKTKKIKFRIKRCDPLGAGICEPFLQAYDLDVTPDMTVLEGLLHIQSFIDPTLAFRRSCRSAICGSCAMRVNGYSKLACNTNIIEEYEKHGDLRVEPMSNHDVIKDLVVDLKPFWQKMEKVKPFVDRKEPSYEESCKPMVMSAEAQMKINDSQKCIMCGCCNSACNALEVDKNYIGPAALAKAWRLVGDERDEAVYSRLNNLSMDHGMYDCVRCVSCTEFCPKGVKPLEQIEKLRSEAYLMGLRDNHGAKHTDSMFDSVHKIGRLDEATMTFKTLGILSSLGMIPMGLKMGLHGKLPRPHMRPGIEGIEEVKKIYEQFEEKHKNKLESHDRRGRRREDTSEKED